MPRLGERHGAEVPALKAVGYTSAALEPYLPVAQGGLYQGAGKFEEIAASCSAPYCGDKVNGDGCGASCATVAAVPETRAGDHATNGATSTPAGLLQLTWATLAVTLGFVVE